MPGVCEGRVVLVTGAGRGIGREHALELARQGASVVVNDLGVGREGQSGDASPAEQVVAEIQALGGKAVADGSDIADWDGAAAAVRAAIDAFGNLDAVVNNAGFVRDRMFVSATVDEWDAVMRVHLRGHFCVARQAVAFWRQRIKDGGTVDARIINTSSGAGVLGSVGQSAYSAAKGGIATLTLVQAAELGRYNITANAICPIARTRMTEEVFGDMMKVPEGGFDAMHAENVAPFVAWLASAQSRAVTGRVFEVAGDYVQVCDGWRHGARVAAGGRRWNAAELGPAVATLLAEATAPEKVYGT